jgi:hypothetical protein
MDIFGIAAAFLRGKHKTYSFTEIVGVIKHPSVGVYTLTGEGTGSITIATSGDKTMHETSVDGGTFVTQLSGDSGLISLSIQQTSNAHKWLLNWYNYLRLSSTKRSEWARAAILIRSLSDGITYTAVGVSPQNFPSVEYQSQGQRLVWNLMCAELRIK